jgi:TRAP-type C4-dicarboxylate transport system permease small subunit
MLLRCLRWSDRCLYNALRFLTGFAFVAVVFSVVAGILYRYVLKSPIGWVEEFSRLSFIWSVFMGACVATRQKEHLRIRIFSGWFGARAKAVQELVTSLLCLVFFAVVLVYGPAIYDAMAAQYYAGMPLSQKWQVLPILVGAAIMSLYLIQIVATIASDLLKGRGQG